VAAHVRAGASPIDRNTLGWSVDSGVASTGWLPGRAADITALGLAWASFSPRFAANTRAADPLSLAPDFEQVIELCHSAVISEHLTVQPDLQYIRHPGGSPARRDALVLLLRLRASF
jgi:porin